MSKKYRAKLILPQGEEIEVMITRKTIVKLVGRDRRKSMSGRVLKYLGIKEAK